MELSIILTTLLQTFASGSPDLCDDVYLDPTGSPYTDAIGQTWSRYCEWTGPDAPTLDADVCCTIDQDGAACTLPDGNGRCWAGAATYCKFGEATSTGAVVCYQPFPSTCELGFCESVIPPDAGPQAYGLCCWEQGCIEVETIDDLKYCAQNGGYSSHCKNGAQNEDGTVDCFD